MAQTFQILKKVAEKTSSAYIFFFLQKCLVKIFFNFTFRQYNDIYYYEYLNTISIFKRK